MNNYYEILEISPKASPEVVKAAYKNLMQRYHPDKNPNNAEALEQLLLIRQAFDVISDANNRASYDMLFNKESCGHTPPPNNPDTKYTAASFAPLNSGGKEYLGKIKVHADIANESREDGLGLLIKFSMFSLLIFIVIMFIFGTKQQREIEAYQAVEKEKLFQAELERSREVLAEKELLEEQNELPIRTLPRFVTALKLNFVSGRLRRTLLIPSVGIVIGKYQKDRVLLHINKNQKAIKESLQQKMLSLDLNRLSQIDGEEYLKYSIQDYLNEIIGTHQFFSKDYGVYGVQEIILKDSFQITTLN